MKITFTILFALSTILTFSQANQWTWVNGADTVRQRGIYGTKGIPSQNNHPGARTDFSSWTDASGNLWLFSGYGYGQTLFGDLNDLWRYNPSSNEWTWISGDSIINVLSVYGVQGVSSPTNSPGCRIVAPTWTDASGNFWLFGSGNSSVTGNLNDLWKFNTSTLEWTWVKGDNIVNVPGVYGTLGVPSISNKPGSRNSSSTWTDASGNLWLFGGFGNTATSATGYLNDLWKYNIATNEWTWVGGSNIVAKYSVYGIQGVTSPTNMPGGKPGSTTWGDGTDNFWLFGGYGYDGFHNPGASNELWKYNITSNLWTFVKGDTIGDMYCNYGTKGISSPSNKPGGGDNSIGYTDITGNFWLFGGYGHTESYTRSLNDLWKYDIATNEWTWVSGDSTETPYAVYGTQGIASASNIPGGTQDSNGWTDLLGNFYVFGGFTFDTDVQDYNADFWKYTPPNTLPVTLVSFNAKRDKEIANLKWNVENESKLDRYEIERSFNSTVFNKIGQVKAIHARQYGYDDNSIEIRGRKVFYRLKMVDIDGRYDYSKIVALDISGNENITVIPNPATTQINIHLNGNIKGRADILIMNSTGVVVSKETHDLNGQDISISTSKFSTGTYLVRVINNGNKYESKVMVIK